MPRPGLTVTTFADRVEWTLPRAAPIACPCCGEQTAADAVIDVSGLPPGLRTVIEQRLGTTSTFVCTARLAILHREKLAGLDMPGAA